MAWSEVNLNLVDSRSNEIMLMVSPTKSSIKERSEVWEFLNKIMICTLGHKNPALVPFGSNALHTFLLDGDIDLNIQFEVKTELEEWKAGLMFWLQIMEKDPEKGKQMSYGALKDILPVKRLGFVPARVPIIKVNVGGFDVDLSYQKMDRIKTWAFFEHVETNIGKDGLFKKSI